MVILALLAIMFVPPKRSERGRPLSRRKGAAPLVCKLEFVVGWFVSGGSLSHRPPRRAAVPHGEGDGLGVAETSLNRHAECRWRTARRGRNAPQGLTKPGASPC